MCTCILYICVYGGYSVWIIFCNWIKIACVFRKMQPISRTAMMWLIAARNTFCCATYYLHCTYTSIRGYANGIRLVNILPYWTNQAQWFFVACQMQNYVYLFISRIVYLVWCEVRSKIAFLSLPFVRTDNN